jgi:hypothetical protein
MGFSRATIGSLVLLVFVSIMYAGIEMRILSFHYTPPILGPILAMSPFDGDENSDSKALTTSPYSVEVVTFPKPVVTPQTPSSFTALGKPILNMSSTTQEGTWQFKATRDSKAYGFTTNQCDIAFPGLFAEIERGVQSQKSSGSNITTDDIDISWADSGVVRAMVFDQEVRVWFHHF